MSAATATIGTTTAIAVLPPVVSPLECPAAAVDVDVADVCVPVRVVDAPVRVDRRGLVVVMTMTVVEGAAVTPPPGNVVGFAVMTEVISCVEVGFGGAMVVDVTIPPPPPPLLGTLVTPPPPPAGGVVVDTGGTGTVVGVEMGGGTTEVAGGGMTVDVTGERSDGVGTTDAMAARIATIDDYRSKAMWQARRVIRQRNDRNSAGQGAPRETRGRSLWRRRRWWRDKGASWRRRKASECAQESKKTWEEKVL
jgi:hypothetical protein